VTTSVAALLVARAIARGQLPGMGATLGAGAAAGRGAGLIAPGRARAADAGENPASHFVRTVENHP
jgi:hypothetical protein